MVSESKEMWNSTIDEFQRSVDISHSVKEAIINLGFKYNSYTIKIWGSKIAEYNLDDSKFKTSKVHSHKSSPIWSMPKEELIDIVRKSKTLKEVLEPFGFTCYGGNIYTLKRRLVQDQIDFSHIYRQEKKTIFAKKTVVFEDVLKENSTYDRSALRRLVIKHKLIPYTCKVCGNEGWWQNKPLTLILDHINGVNNDHRLENLRFLCGSCNSQTPTFCGRKTVKYGHRYVVDKNGMCVNVIPKNKTQQCSKCGAWIYKNSKTGLCIECYTAVRKKVLHIDSKKRKKECKNQCVNCGRLIKDTSNRCRTCANLVKNSLNRKVIRPSYDQLKQDVNSMSMVAVGKKYGVSDNAVRKWIKCYEK